MGLGDCGFQLASFAGRAFGSSNRRRPFLRRRFAPDLRRPPALSNGRLRHGKARLRCRNGGMDSDRLRGHSLRHRSQHLGLQRPFPPFRHPVHHVFTASHDRPEVKVGAVVGFAGSRGLRLGVDRQTSESPTAFGGGAFWCFGCGSTHWPQQYIRRDRYSGLMGSRHAPSFSTVTNAPVPDISAEAQIRRSY